MPEDVEEDANGVEEMKTTSPELCGEQENSANELNTQNNSKKYWLVSKPKALQGWGSFFRRYIPLRKPHNSIPNSIAM